MHTEIRANAANPVIWKGAPLPNTAGSMASTTVTMSSPFTMSYAADLCDLGVSSVSLPAGSLDKCPSSDEKDIVYEGSRYGKCAGRSGPYRGGSIESMPSFDELDTTEKAEVFVRLSLEADRMSRSVGGHVKVEKLTTSKTCPYKVFLRRT